MRILGTVDSAGHASASADGGTSRIPDTNLPAMMQVGAVGDAATPVAARVLHIGSGKAFRTEWLNLDCNPTWKPDLVADLEKPIPAGHGLRQANASEGSNSAPGMFERIVAHDVLEHVRDLTTCMATCRDLLAVGGVFEILVPYDLSHGAWQDPTHVRAFNERSLALLRRMVLVPRLVRAATSPPRSSTCA